MPNNKNMNGAHTMGCDPKDAACEQICKAQQDRINAEELDRRDMLIKRKELCNALLCRRIRRTYHMCDRVFMFLSGVNAAFAVHFFVKGSIVGFGLSVVFAFLFKEASDYCEKHSRSKMKPFI